MPATGLHRSRTYIITFGPKHIVTHLLLIYTDIVIQCLHRLTLVAVILLMLLSQVIQQSSLGISPLTKKHLATIPYMLAGMIPINDKYGLAKVSFMLGAYPARSIS